jgi:hypothetical protein
MDDADIHGTISLPGFPTTELSGCADVELVILISGN